MEHTFVEVVPFILLFIVMIGLVSIVAVDEYIRYKEDRDG